MTGAEPHKGPDKPTGKAAKGNDIITTIHEHEKN
jgi:hypothetical protein